jgi:hypothetical protein
VFALQRAAFACGEDNQTEHVSNARLNRHDAECRLAEGAITERLETLECERDALIAENALTQRACDSWRKLAMDRLDELAKLKAEKGQP